MTVSSKKSSEGIAIDRSAAYAVLDPAIHRFLDAREARGRSPFYDHSGDEAKAAFATMQQAHHDGELHSLVTMQEHAIHGLAPIRFRIVRPALVEGKVPVILYFHGGGSIAGGWSTHRDLAAELALQASAAVVFVEQGVGGTGFQKELGHAVAVFDHLLDEVAHLYLDMDRVAVVGDGSGATLGTSLVWEAARRKRGAIRFQALLSPWSMCAASEDGGEDEPWLSRARYRALVGAIFPDAEARACSPTHAGFVALEAMPPTLVITADHDATRHGAELYASRLMQAGVDVVAARYAGTIHDFAVISELAGTAPARAARAQIAACLREAWR